MFTLEEKSREWERRHPQYARKATPENQARYAAMAEEAAELAESAEKCAMSELLAFGSAELLIDTGCEWANDGGIGPWKAALDDYYEVTGELCTDEVFGFWWE